MAHRRLFAILPLVLLVLGCSDAPTLTGSGTWRVINYWAIWCTPCREEIPELNRLALRDDITVLGVNFDAKQGNSLAADSAALGIQFLTIDDPSAMLGVTRPDKLPTTLIIDPDGNLVVSLVGPQTEDGLAMVIANSGQKNADPRVGE
ncbi:MAG: thioredoxin [Halieaceae bacterium MED-G27]|nr:thioredoxin [Halieaceae bacterium]OUT64235.1 MAG: hypothetical protein CBB81_10120 [Cellvibrionales bacterium TMED21]PDH38078.1 MAG: thioredoxin [Halieaceae bacterium MED-G27]